jgi:hypothetical protein
MHAHMAERRWLIAAAAFRVTRTVFTIRETYDRWQAKSLAPLAALHDLSEGSAARHLSGANLEQGALANYLQAAVPI